jgi:dTDP-4-dehydrorhamnose 3,5-epimerase
MSAPTITALTVTTRRTLIAGVVVVEGASTHDDRGSFARVLDTDALAAAGVTLSSFGWISRSVSRRATIRGLHLRVGAGEHKIVSCVAGRALDVLVDGRVGSASYGRVEYFALNSDTLTSIVVPPGVAHGFQALVDGTVMSYMIDRAHDPTAEVVIAFDDPVLGIAWPLPNPVISARDRCGLRLHEAGGMQQ